MDDASLIGLFEVKASRRAGALKRWIAARESLAAAVQVVIDELAPLLTADERTRFLDAEGLHRPLGALPLLGWFAGRLHHPSPGDLFASFAAAVA